MIVLFDRSAMLLVASSALSGAACAPTQLAGVTLRTVHVGAPLPRPVSLLEAVDAPALLDDGAEGHPIDGSDAYGAELWPSSLVAAVALVERCRPGNTVLELGCGAGLTTLAALDAGAKVTATDWSPFSLALVEASAEAFQPSRRDKLRTMHFDVCDPQLELPPAADFLVIADMLYDAQMAQALGVHAAKAVAAGATLIVADTERFEGRMRSIFLYALRHSSAGTRAPWVARPIGFQSVPLPSACRTAAFGSLRWSGDDQATEIGLLVLEAGAGAG